MQIAKSISKAQAPHADDIRAGPRTAATTGELKPKYHVPTHRLSYMAEAACSKDRAAWAGDDPLLGGLRITVGKRLWLEGGGLGLQVGPGSVNRVFRTVGVSGGMGTAGLGLSYLSSACSVLRVPPRSGCHAASSSSSSVNCCPCLNGRSTRFDTCLDSPRPWRVGHSGIASETARNSYSYPCLFRCMAPRIYPPIHQNTISLSTHVSKQCSPTACHFIPHTPEPPNICSTSMPSILHYIFRFFQPANHLASKSSSHPIVQRALTTAVAPKIAPFSPQNSADFATFFTSPLRPAPPQALFHNLFLQHPPTCPQQPLILGKV